jgi:hypothetical protein
VWDQLHVLLLKKLRSAKKLDWSRAVIDSSHVRAARRGPKAVPARSTAHARAASTTVPGVAGVVGQPRQRPDALLADRGYDHDKYRRLLWQRGIRPVIAERGQPHSSGRGGLDRHSDALAYLFEQVTPSLHT